jgi:hypothetical protein
MRPSLIAPKAKVVPFLRKLLADGEALAAQRPATLEECYALSEAGTQWVNWAGKVLRRAFDEQPFWLHMFHNPKDMPGWPDGPITLEFMETYRQASWRHKLELMRQAIAAAEASQ